VLQPLVGTRSHACGASRTTASGRRASVRTITRTPSSCAGSRSIARSRSQSTTVFPAFSRAARSGPQEDQVDAAARTAARTFINATSRLDGDELYVSEIFRWYRKDFGNAPDAVLRAVARHLYDRDAAAFIEREWQRIRLAYTPYDWRLNR
jgi:hypothetical protein